MKALKIHQMNAPRKILIMKFRNIGDVLLTTPLVSELARIYPRAQIHFALNSGTESMLSGNPHISKLHIYDRSRIKSGGLLARLKGEWEYFKSLKKEHFDLIIQSTEGRVWIAHECCR